MQSLVRQFLALVDSGCSCESSAGLRWTVLLSCPRSFVAPIVVPAQADFCWCSRITTVNPNQLRAFCGPRASAGLKQIEMTLVVNNRCSFGFRFLSIRGTPVCLERPVTYLLYGVCVCVSGYQHCTTGVNAVNTNLSVQVGAVVVVVGFGYQTRANGYRRFVGSGRFRSRRLVRRRRIPVRLHAARTKQTAGRKLNLSSPTTSSSTAKVDVCLFEMWFAVRWERHVTLPQFVWQRFVPSVWLAMTQRVVSYKTLSSRRRASTVKLNTSL